VLVRSRLKDRKARVERLLALREHVNLAVAPNVPDKPGDGYAGLSVGLSTTAPDKLKPSCELSR
jgi:hypothetical protein